MNSPARISTVRQRELLAEAAELIRERAATEQALRHGLEEGIAECQSRCDAEFHRLTAEFQEQSKALDTSYVGGLEHARHRYEADLDAVRQQCGIQAQDAEVRYRESREAAELSWRQTRALTIDHYENEKKSAAEVGEQARITVAGYQEQLSWLEQQAGQMLRRRGLRSADPPPTNLAVGETTAQLLKRYSSAASAAHEQLQQVAQWRSTRFLDEGWPLLIFFVTLLFSVFPFGNSWGWRTWHWLAASGTLAALVAVVSRQIVHYVVRGKARSPLAAMQVTVADARDAVSRAKTTVERELTQRQDRLVHHREEQLQQADQAWKQISSDLDREFQEQTAAIQHRLQASEKQLEARWDAEARPFREEFPPRIEQRKQQFANDTQALKDRQQSELDGLQADFDSAWAEMAQRYTRGMRRATEEIAAMQKFCRNHAVPFEDVDWDEWTPASDALPTVSFGSYEVDLNRFEGGLPDDERLRLDVDRWNPPAVLAFPESPSLLVEATEEGRDEAIRVMRNVMLRMLTSLPAGKVRFTIIDPTGLGQNFSEFMHLADYDERLVASRIWTEAAHIHQRLADLTEHMENVIQKYLRNEFASIQDYNVKAGEVAEPYQVLVIANFPANFSEETARRLVSIATSGARCGVSTLISVDMKMALPRNFDLGDLEAQANTVAWEDGRFVWKPESLRPFPLQLERPVEGETLTRIVRAAGEHAKDANRVEVPFEAVVPPADSWWTHDSGDEIKVPLGRAGATSLQFLQLGKGTSQHVLVSGKTGSGKSTLMHALITNLAIHYSPGQIEFFLVDFKKGVEFKTYAQYRLPHARVVAIESEREFGMSVLERMDGELRRRGDLFRDTGVQGLAAYRAACPDQTLPRQLLVVDEFQEFFVKDDKIAQDASLLLDRLVRQGRAFGIHVLLGSQTLAGAYSLARSTLGQMAVRIALQCSEADAHLILSEDNTAARLLSRPGEAIYNNANGLFEGNHPFQVVWLPDSQREHYLKEIERLSRDRQTEVSPTIVFEGNVAADPSGNAELRKCLQSVPSAALAAAPKAWLGSAIAIKEPTHAVFRRHSGSHLLIVGQQEELAAGVLGTSLISLAACQPPRPSHPGSRAARFVILDGGGFEATDVALASRIQRRLPLEIESVPASEVDARIGELAREVAALIDAPESHEPVYLAIYNLARFRTLRKSDDDYGLSGFSDDSSSASPAQNLVYLLREGPPQGVHVLIWCDTYNNVTRWFDRATLRDLAHRVLFQMSATDSSNLIDSAAASHLGSYRAVYYNDELGESERFRPYAAPTIEWLDQVAQQLASAGTAVEEQDRQLMEPQ